LSASQKHEISDLRFGKLLITIHWQVHIFTHPFWAMHDRNVFADAKMHHIWLGVSEVFWAIFEKCGAQMLTTLSIPNLAAAQMWWWLGEQHQCALLHNIVQFLKTLCIILCRSQIQERCTGI